MKEQDKKQEWADSGSIVAVDIIVEDRSGRSHDLRNVEIVAKALLEELGIRSGELGVSMVTAREMETLNKRHMNREGATDVLSFPLDMDESDSVGEIPVLLGDVIVCPEVAEKQAQAAGHSSDAEICLLLIHGLLHIAGYDHETDAGEMDALQSRFFGELCDKH